MPSGTGGFLMPVRSRTHSRARVSPTRNNRMTEQTKPASPTRAHPGPSPLEVARAGHGDSAGPGPRDAGADPHGDEATSADAPGEASTNGAHTIGTAGNGVTANGAVTNDAVAGSAPAAGETASGAPAA